MKIKSLPTFLCTLIALGGFVTFTASCGDKKDEDAGTEQEGDEDGAGTADEAGDKVGAGD